jgi:hypothetical protein
MASPPPHNDSVESVQHFRFMHLPVGVRLQIYRYALSFPGTLSVYQVEPISGGLSSIGFVNDPGPTPFHERLPLICGDLGILFTSRQIRAEAANIIYSENRFAPLNLYQLGQTL